jgi:hypothetical protein
MTLIFAKLDRRLVGRVRRSRNPTFGGGLSGYADANPTYESYVVAVAHQHREPDYWIDRMGEQ